MTQEAEKTKLTWEEKITDILLKAIMTGGIGVGGANAFWELFIKSDIPNLYYAREGEQAKDSNENGSLI